MFYHLLKNRRSIRQYKNQSIESEKVDILIKSALLSPSSRGKRPWEFILVDNPKIIEQLSESKTHGSAFLKSAPLAIVVIADATVSDVWVEDTAIAATIIQLMVEHLELASCWVQIRERMHDADVTSEAYVKTLLDIPETYKVASIIGIGYANEKKPGYKEEDLLYDKIHRNTYA